MYSKITKLEFVFNEVFDAHPFVKMLMDSAITDLTMSTSAQDYTCTVVYEIDEGCIAPQDAIDDDLDFLRGENITPKSYRIIE